MPKLNFLEGWRIFTKAAAYRQWFSDGLASKLWHVRPWMLWLKLPTNGKGPGVGKDMMPSQKDRCRELQPVTYDQDPDQDQGAATRNRWSGCKGRSESGSKSGNYNHQPAIDDQDQPKKIMRIKMHKMVLIRRCCSNMPNQSLYLTKVANQFCRFEKCRCLLLP